MKKFFSGFWRFSKFFLIFFFASSLFFVILYRFINPPVTPLMVMRLFRQTSDGQSLKLQKQWVSPDEISREVPLAVIASEDNLFFEHNGFDLKAIEKAKEYNLEKKGRKIRGASTISQQTAKNVFLWPARSWVRKGLEAYFTVLIEFFWGKERILEIYLNVIETGPGIYGIEAASQKYFGTPAARLNRSESALIAAILPNPLKWNPANPTPYLISRQEWILWNMGNIGTVKFGKRKD